MTDDPMTQVLALLHKLDARLERVETGQDGLRADVAGLVGVIDRLRAEFDRLRAEFDGLRGEFDGIRGEFDGIRGEFTSLRAGQERLEASFERLSANHERLEAALVRLRADVMDRIDRLQDALTVQQEEAVVNFAVADRAERIALSARDEARSMAEQLTAMMRIVRRLDSDVRQLRGGV